MATEERLIKASTLLKAIEPVKVTWRFGVPNTLYTMVDFLRIIINEQPAVDAVEVVRCKDCKHWNVHPINGKLTLGKCAKLSRVMADIWYCSYGERRPDDH